MGGKQSSKDVKTDEHISGDDEGGDNEEMENKLSKSGKPQLKKKEKNLDQKTTRIQTSNEQRRPKKTNKDVLSSKDVKTDEHISGDGEGGDSEEMENKLSKSGKPQLKKKEKNID